MEFFNQPFDGALAVRLRQLLHSTDYQTLNIIVAFAQRGGVDSLKNEIEVFREGGGEVNTYVGFDLQGTSYEALIELLSMVDTLYVVHAESNQTFHPKIYDFEGDSKTTIIVGSHNLTNGGLWTNIESSVIINSYTSIQEAANLSGQVREYLSKLRDNDECCRQITSQGEIDELLHNNYICKEADQKIRATRIISTADSQGSHASFGTGYLSPHPPRNKRSNLEGDVHTVDGKQQQTPEGINLPDFANSPSEDTIWLETRQMTGGSRNQLDLSSRSLLDQTYANSSGRPSRKQQKYIQGVVEFFGVDPKSEHDSREIALLFDGETYHGNHILFPTGENANGTWRLQINGATNTGTKITDAFKAKGGEHFLMNKVVTFTRIDDAYFSMSVYPASMVEDFTKHSLIVAHNGVTTQARTFGFLR